MQFEILEIPGKGAHATVCLARSPGSDEVVCLKVLQKDYGTDSEPAMRVRDEARLLERLDHPNIVKLHQRVRIQGREVLVMEWVNGEQIQRLVRRRGSLPATIALAITRDVARAAHYAHQLPEGPDGQPLMLVHRDLNLTNILLSLDGEVKVLDFGLARARFEDRESDTLITLRGTAGYTPPEGLDGEDDRMDVYSLGISLLFMLTGHLPVFSRQRLSYDIRLSEVCTYISEMTGLNVEPGPITELIRGMVAFDMDERLRMAEVVERLERMELRVDLDAYARAAVGPMVEERSRIPVSEHPSYDELAFLEEDQGATKGDANFRKLLREPGWYEREGELSWMLIRHPDWSGRPLVDYLRRAARPWWQVWNSPPPKQGVLAALRLLELRRNDDAEAVFRALSRHKDAEIAELAASLRR